MTTTTLQTVETLKKDFNIQLDSAKWAFLAQGLQNKFKNHKSYAEKQTDKLLDLFEKYGEQCRQDERERCAKSPVPAMIAKEIRNPKNK